MTPASEIAISPAHIHDARPSDRARVYGGRWERVFAVLGVCLPVPLLAITGLSIPLPAGVERIAAALVAWVDTSVDGADQLGLGDRGAIILASGERALFQAPSGPEPDTARRVVVFQSPPGTAPGAEDDGTPPQGEGGGGGSGGGGNGGGSTPPDGGGDDPDDETGLVEGTVETITETPLVEEVDKTLGELSPTSDDESSGGLLEDTLANLGL